MPLQTGILQPSPDMWGVNFQMMTRGGNSVRCRVTKGALDRLLADAGQYSSANSASVFAELRPRLERIASRKYDESHVARNAFLLIGPEDLVLERR
jgi:Protein of unknown function (DUF1488)